jgi:hypothetical protein
MNKTNITKEYLGFEVRPTGHLLLLMPIRPSEKIGSIYLPSNTQDSMQSQQEICLVLAMGDNAYRQEGVGAELFANGPFCQVGDWVDTNQYEKHPKRWQHLPKILCYYVNDTRILGTYSDEDVEKALGMKLTANEIREEMKQKG